MHWDVIVIGGGPAGMMAAARAGARGRKVLLLERNEKLGKKLFLTGKGRCNVTNAADIESFIENTVHNPKFLYSAFYTFTNADLMSFFEENGLELKTERGGRVFPVSDKSYDVTRVFERYLKAHRVDVKLHVRVKDIVADQSGKRVIAHGGETYHCASVVIATGGASYSSTGSTGDGYGLAKKLGHSIVDIEPSLVPLRVKEDWVERLRGLLLKNVELSVFVGRKKVQSDFGEMLFMSDRVSGPTALTLSASIRDILKRGDKPVLSIDLKPGLSEEVLDKRIQRDFVKYSKKTFGHSLDDLLPKQLIPVIVELSGVDKDKRVSEVSKTDRAALLALLKDLRLSVECLGDIEEAIITSGGVSTREIDPSTMESKLVEGLYFAGELIDVDALTGGYNLQIAFSTGYLAGDNA